MLHVGLWDTLYRKYMSKRGSTVPVPSTTYSGLHVAAESCAVASHSARPTRGVAVSAQARNCEKMISAFYLNPPETAFLQGLLGLSRGFRSYRA